MAKKIVDDDYTQLLKYLEYTLHELPTGVLYDSDGASEKKCAELMAASYQLEKMAVDRGIEISEFLGTCRWHYERYPHYLSRHKHFGSYANYMAKHHAPTRTKV